MNRDRCMAETIATLRQAAEGLRTFAANVEALAYLLDERREGDAECERAIASFARQFAERRWPTEG